MLVERASAADVAGVAVINQSGRRRRVDFRLRAGNKLGHLVGGPDEGSREFVAEPQIQRQAWQHLPIVLEERMKRLASLVGMVPVVFGKAHASEHKVGQGILTVHSGRRYAARSGAGAHLAVEAPHELTTELDGVPVPDPCHRIRPVERLVQPKRPVGARCNASRDGNTGRRGGINAAPEDHLAAEVHQRLFDGTAVGASRRVVPVPRRAAAHEVEPDFVQEGVRQCGDVIDHQIVLPHCVQPVGVTGNIVRVLKCIVLVCAQIEVADGEPLFRVELVIDFTQHLPLVGFFGLKILVPPVRGIGKRKDLVNDVHCHRVEA